MTIDANFGHLLRSAAKQIQPPQELRNKVMELIEFKNENGEILAKINIDSFTPLDPLNEIRQQIQPGTGVAVYVVDNNPERKIRNETFYQGEPWTQGFEELLRVARPFTFKIVREGKLKDIHVIYGFDYLTDDEVEDMYKEAKISGCKIVTRPLRRSNNIVGVDINYELDTRSVKLIVLNTTKSRIHVPDVEKHQIERMTVGLHDAVYLSDGLHQQFIWIEEAPQRLQYELRTTTEFTKQALLDMALKMHHPNILP